LLLCISHASAGPRQPVGPIPEMPSVGPLQVAPPRELPLGVVPYQSTSAALQDARDRYLYQVPEYGCFGDCHGGYGFGLGAFGYGGFGGCGGNIPYGFSGAANGAPRSLP
jgi:hypothetical protein